MKIQLDVTGRVIAYGTDANAWPYTAPAWINGDNFNRWVATNTADLQNPASWLESTPPSVGAAPIEVIRKHINWGMEFRARVIEQIKIQNMTDSDRLGLLNKIKDAMNSLDYGDIIVSRAVFNTIATDGTQYTAARKTWVLQQLDAYIASI